MPYFVVTINQVVDVDYAIEAANAEEAEAKVLAGAGVEIDTHIHASETSNVEENPMVAAHLSNR